MMVIDNKFNIGDLVYIVTDTDQNPQQVTQIVVTQSGLVYHISGNSGIQQVYDFELSYDRNTEYVKL